eukprot:scaffold79514_cov29-Tisochrysis_lutea.AAC.1
MKHPPATAIEAAGARHSTADRSCRLLLDKADELEQRAEFIRPRVGGGVSGQEQKIPHASPGALIYDPCGACTRRACSRQVKLQTDSVRLYGCRDPASTACLAELIAAQAEQRGAEVAQLPEQRLAQLGYPLLRSRHEDLK